jgi:hypothetical protein
MASGRSNRPGQLALACNRAASRAKAPGLPSNAGKWMVDLRIDVRSSQAGRDCGYMPNPCASGGDIVRRGRLRG